MKKISLPVQISYKAIYCTIICCALSSKVTFCAAESILRESKNNFILKSTIIKCVDGWPIDADVFFLIVKNKKEIRDRVYGKIDTKVQTKKKEDIKRFGMYDFCGKNCSLLELVDIENELENNKSKYTQQEYQKTKDALANCLEKAKEDFIAITKSYVEGVNGVKGYILTLIEEFCGKKSIKECFLLKWGETEAGQEEVIIKQGIVNFKEFTQFCIDLADFLDVLKNSCPKGAKKFETKYNIKV